MTFGLVVITVTAWARKLVFSAPCTGLAKKGHRYVFCYLKTICVCSLLYSDVEKADYMINLLISLFYASILNVTFAMGHLLEGGTDCELNNWEGRKKEFSRLKAMACRLSVQNKDNWRPARPNFYHMWHLCWGWFRWKVVRMSLWMFWIVHQMLDE